MLEQYEEAFFKSTGIRLKLVPPGEPKQRLSCGKHDNVFCGLVAGTLAGCDACLESQRRLHRNTRRKLVTQQGYCFAGLTEVLVPVLVDGRHVATLMGGQVFRREPTQRDFDMVMNMLGDGFDKEDKRKAHRAYFETPAIPLERLQAAICLLDVFARHLVEEVNCQVAAPVDLEPEAIRSAKAFIRSHAGESITLEQVLLHVHVSRFHFCKIFKKATGVTLTEYVARSRVETAKTLLAESPLRITEIAFASGFGSIPQFNSVFKRAVGIAPTHYRIMRRGQSHP